MSFDIRKFLAENKLTKASKALLNENFSDSQSDLHSYIFHWYLDSNPNAEEMSRGDLDWAVKKHEEEFLATKDRYRSLQHYLNAVAKAGDWYETVHDEDLMENKKTKKQNSMSFDIRKFLIENKLTKASKALLKENYSPEMEEMSMEEPSMEETLDAQPADVDPTDGGGVSTSFDASKYESVEELMREIEVTANKAALQEKMKRVKEAYETLDKKATALEEGEDSKYISPTKLKEMKKNAKTLRKMYEKYEKDYDKRYNEQMKPKKKLNEQFDNNRMMANINALNGVLKDEVRRIVGAGFDAKNQDLDYSFLTPQNYSDNLLLTAMSDRGGVYFQWMAKEQVDEEEYEMIRNGYGDLEMLAELVDGVFYDHRGTVAEQIKSKKKKLTSNLKI